MEKQQEAVNNSVFVIKLLNRKLSGCEYQLNDGETSIVIGNEHEIFSNDRLGEQELILIPDDEISDSFVIYVDESLGSASYTTSNGTQNLLEKNMLHTVCGISFAIKLSHEEWKIKEKNSFIKESSKPKRSQIFLISLLAIALVATCFVIWNNVKDKYDKKLTDIQEILGAHTKDSQIIIGNDKNNYIMANNNKMQFWISQSLRKNHIDNDIVVLDKLEEIKKIHSLINLNFSSLKVHAIRFNEPGFINISLSTERSHKLNKKENENLKSKIINIFPYLADVKLDYVSDRIVSEQVQNSIEKITKKYNKKSGADYVSFVLEGTKDDSEISALQSFVNQFHKEWQTDYVKIIIKIEDNWMKDKSYVYATEGFVKMSSMHWFFPEEIN